MEIKFRRERLLALMERLDTEFASLKKASKDQSKTEQERLTAADGLKKRESDLMPTYKQIALLYADLHEYVSSNFVTCEGFPLTGRTITVELEGWKPKVVLSL